MLHEPEMMPNVPVPTDISTSITAQRFIMREGPAVRIAGAKTEGALQNCELVADLDRVRPASDGSDVKSDCFRLRDFEREAVSRDLKYAITDLCAP